MKAIKVATYQPRHSLTQPNWFTMQECVKKLLCEQHQVLPGLKKKWTPYVLTDRMFDFLRHRKLIIAHEASIEVIEGMRSQEKDNELFRQVLARMLPKEHKQFAAAALDSAAAVLDSAAAALDSAAAVLHSEDM